MTKFVAVAMLVALLVAALAIPALAQGATKVPCGAVESQYGVLAFPGVGGNAVVTGNGDLNTDPCTSRIAGEQYGI